MKGFAYTVFLALIAGGAWIILGSLSSGNGLGKASFEGVSFATSGILIWSAAYCLQKRRRRKADQLLRTVRTSWPNTNRTSERKDRNVWARETVQGKERATNSILLPYKRSKPDHIFINPNQ